MNLFQVIFTIVFVGLITKLFFDAKKGKTTVYVFVFWTLIWLAGLIFILDPSISQYIAKLVGIQRGVDVIVYSSIILLLFIVLKIYLQINKINSRIKDLNSKISVLEKQLKPQL